MKSLGVILGLLFAVGCTDAPEIVEGDPTDDGAGETCGRQTQAGMRTARRPPPPPGDCNCNLTPPPCCCDTPIVLDIAGDGIELTSPKHGVVFEIRDEKFGPWSWTTEGSDDAWLVMDNSGEGLIEHGSELFSSAMPQPLAPEGPSHGYNALKYHDSNGDGVVDSSDARWKDMRLWQDKNHDGKSAEEELHTMEDLGVAGLSVDYEEHNNPDGCGNVFKYSAGVIPTQGSTVSMTAWDVVLASEVGPNAVTEVVREPPHPKSWRARRLRFKAEEEERRRRGEPRRPFHFKAQTAAGGPPIICPYFFDLKDPYMTSGSTYPPPILAKARTLSFWWWEQPVPHPECNNTRSAELDTRLFQEVGPYSDRQVADNTVLTTPSGPINDGVHRCVVTVPQCYRPGGLVLQKPFFATIDTRMVGLPEIPTQDGFTDTVQLPCHAIPPEGCTNLEEEEEQ